MIKLTGDRVNQHDEGPLLVCRACVIVPAAAVHSIAATAGRFPGRNPNCAHSKSSNSPGKAYTSQSSRAYDRQLPISRNVSIVLFRWSLQTPVACTLRYA